MDLLSRKFLPQFSTYQFAIQLSEQIPKMMMKIRDSVKSEFAAWLLSIRESSKELGALVMTQTQENMKIEERKNRARGNQQQFLTSSVPGQALSQQARDAVQATMMSFREGEETDDKQSILFVCLLILDF